MSKHTPNRRCAYCHGLFDEESTQVIESPASEKGNIACNLCYGLILDEWEDPKLDDLDIKLAWTDQ